jgi:CRP-like cAMP-binding protein
MASFENMPVNRRSQTNPRGGLFDHLEAETVRSLISLAHVRSHDAGEVLFSEGDQ